MFWPPYLNQNHLKIGKSCYHNNSVHFHYLLKYFFTFWMNVSFLLMNKIIVVINTGSNSIYCFCFRHNKANWWKAFFLESKGLFVCWSQFYDYVGFLVISCKTAWYILASFSYEELNDGVFSYLDQVQTWKFLFTIKESKASLRLRLFYMMKYMHQHKQKRWKHFGFVAKINFFLLSLI